MDLPLAAGRTASKALLGGLVNYGKSAASSLASGLASVASGVLGIGAMVGGAAVAGVGGFPQLQQAILSMTTGSGKFAGMMAAQSQTVSGLFSTPTASSRRSQGTPH